MAGRGVWLGHVDGKSLPGFRCLESLSIPGGKSPATVWGSPSLISSGFRQTHVGASGWRCRGWCVRGWLSHLLAV